MCYSIHVLASFPGSTQLLIAIKSWGVEPGNEAIHVCHLYLRLYGSNFAPPYPPMQTVVLNVFDRMVETVCSVPRVETKLYPSESAHASKPNLRPIISETLLHSVKEKVHCN